MTDKVVVLTTCNSTQEAHRIAKALVQERLAACVNLSGPIRSLYRWQGRLCDEDEVVLMIKTSRALFDRVRRAIEKLHSYQVPEVLCLPVIDGAPNYLNWLTTAVVTEAAAAPARRPVRPRSARQKKQSRRATRDGTTD